MLQCQFYKLNFLLWENYGTELEEIIETDPLCFYPVPPMANISAKYSTIAQPEYWHWHSRGPRFQNYTDTSKFPL